MRHGNEGDYLETGLHYRGLFFLDLLHANSAFYQRRENQSEVFFGTKGAVFKFGRGKREGKGRRSLEFKFRKTSVSVDTFAW